MTAKELNRDPWIKAYSDFSQTPTAESLAMIQRSQSLEKRASIETMKKDFPANALDQLK